MYHNHNHNHNHKEPNTLIDELTSHMFDCKNLRQFTKHTIDFASTKDIIKDKRKELKKEIIKDKRKEQQKEIIKKIEFYKPKQKDSLFWCFFILKYGFSKYEMEVGNQHFQIEKQEKFKYIDQIRKTCNKDLLKMHKIKPLTLLEDDLANQERISVKTFCALCIIENINIILIDKRKIYEVLTTDDPKINIIHRNSITYEHQIEVDILPETINMYKETYYNVPNFDVSLKSMASYKVDELLELCKKLDINTTNDAINDNSKKKQSKKDIYELLVQKF